LLLGLLREDKALAQRFLPSPDAVVSIRKEIETHTVPQEKVSTSVDLPLSHDCKRVLSYGAEEAERLNHQHIGTEHLLLALLREEKCFAAQLLAEQGLTLDSLRTQLQESQLPLAQARSASFARLDQWLADCEASGGFYVLTEKRGPNRTPSSPFTQPIKIKKRNKARTCEKFTLEDSPPQRPLLCIWMIRDEHFAEVQQRCEDSIAKGVTQVWLLDPAPKRAYTFTKAEGLRECRGGILHIANTPLEMNLKTIFD
jgi:hypothetical protein